MTRTPMLLNIFAGLLFITVLVGCNDSGKKEFYNQIAIVPDTLTVDNSQETVITCPKGTVLNFDKETFVLPDGTVPKGRVSLVIKECYSEADMIRENLSTTSDGHLLETMGMVNIKAFADGQELQLKEGKAFVISYPNANRGQEGMSPMSLFYGEKSDTGGLNWKIDSNSLLKIVPAVTTTGWMGTHYDDSSNFKGLLIAGTPPVPLERYVLEKFDISKLDTAPDLETYYDIDFVVSPEGKITDINIERFNFYDTDTGRTLQPDRVVTAYIKRFVEQIPPLMPLKAKVDDRYIPFHAECHFSISFRMVQASDLNNESYASQFRKKYGAFAESSIVTMNEAEMRYYSFAASKLGWINCDYFVNTPGPKINFVVRPIKDSNPDIKLIFKKTKSIMQGQKQDGNIVFNNIPAGEEVKIVAISFKGSKPMLAIAHTKTSKEIFDKLEYKEFSLADLDKQLNDQ